MTNLESDARDLMEQIQMAESRHMQKGALVSYQLQNPDMTIRDFFGMAASEIEDQVEDFYCSTIQNTITQFNHSLKMMNFAKYGTLSKLQ